MSVKDRTTKTDHINVTAREIDFVTRFGANAQALLDIIGASRPVRKELGSAVKAKRGLVTLQSGSVAEGDEIPYSQSQVQEIPLTEMALRKWAKGVTAEAIKTYGYDVAIEKTDKAFLNELQAVCLHDFYSFLNDGELTYIETTFQAALAMAKGLVLNRFAAAHLTCTDVVGFMNIKDFYSYLGAATVTVQTEFGYTYIRNFMGYNVIFLCADDCLASGKVIATPVENIIMYYVDPSDGGFAAAGLEYTVAGDTPLIGFHTEGNYAHAVSDCFAILGLSVVAEYVDGIAVVEIEASGSLGSVTVASAAGTATGDSKITITYTAGSGEKLYYKDATAAATPTYKEILDLTGWTAIESGVTNVEGLTSGNKITVISVNGGGQAVASGNATIVVKS